MEKMEADSFSYLADAAYASGQSARTVAEAKPFLPSNITTDEHRVVAVILSGLRHDAFHQIGNHDGAALARWRLSLGADESVLCKLLAELPSVSVPNWMALHMGLRSEVHGLLGNRGPADQKYSSTFEVPAAINRHRTLLTDPLLPCFSSTNTVRSPAITWAGVEAAQLAGCSHRDIMASGHDALCAPTSFGRWICFCIIFRVRGMRATTRALCSSLTGFRIGFSSSPSPCRRSLALTLMLMILPGRKRF